MRITGIIAIVGTLMLMAGARVSMAQNSATASATAAADTKWIDAWAVSFLPTLVNGSVQNSGVYHDQTVRFFVFPALGGGRARVQFTNKFGEKPLVIGAAHIALRKPAAPSERPARPQNDIAEGTDRTLTFAGKESVTLPPGEEIWSDPVELAVTQHQDVAISVYLPEEVRPTGFHPTGLKTAFISASGNHAGDVSMPLQAGRGRGGGMGPTTDIVVFISGLQVMAPAKTRVIVTLGDSITDGAASADDANGSWPSVLSQRLPALKDGTPVSVINMGIGSNRFISADAAGPTGVKRLQADVLDRPNVTHLIVLEGINDISYEQEPAEKLIAGYKDLIAKAHAKGIKVYGATLLPIQNSRKDTPENIATQQAVNKWIRESGAFDAVLDFEKVVQDLQNPLRIRRELTGDFVHPNTQGYRLIGESIDLKLFQ